MRSEREKITGKVAAATLRLNIGRYELPPDEDTCYLLLVSEGSVTLEYEGGNERAGVILLGAGAGHHFQQGTDAALPLHRCIQHCALPGRKQAAEIPPGCVFQIMQHPQRKVAPHDLRHGAAGLCKAAAAGAKQHGAAGVYQYALPA